VVRYLLEQGADVSCREQNGETPLHEAARNGDEEMIRLLLKWGADVNAQDSAMGSTPLFEARVFEKKEAEKLLIEGGADVKLVERLHFERIDDETGRKMLVQTRIPDGVKLEDEHILSKINGKKLIPNFADQEESSKWAQGFLNQLVETMRSKNEHGAQIKDEKEDSGSQSNRLVVKNKFVYRL
jgi:ankyrin repeat protein